ncbi:Vacuolar acid trehalase [Chlorella sorokiniana]|uniref:Vacuolar acid trehalase n=1 Tax=Chlorella sorokiniana TaxID=3076 RepID=A0A2P6U5I0_CHLSO|nr:Vacuolar acid trehalase [Chlorella sorokiniana]|eukprot:PRW61570.1 Vacuolar acid trehalase [Chlorella sorokiniana]
MLSSRSAPACSPAARAVLRHATHSRRRVTPVAAELTPAGGAKLVDLTGGRRLVAVPQQLDPRNLEDVRGAPAFGPRGLLLVGFSELDCAAVQAWFRQMEPGFVVAPCPAALLASGTLGDALGSGVAAAAIPQQPWEALPAGTPPVAFFSGISGQEQVALMEAWNDCTGLDAPAFASVTPSILDKPLARLLSDIVRAQAQAPPPGMDGGTVAEVQQARAAGAADAGAAAAAEAAAAAAPSEGQRAKAAAGSSEAAAPAEGGEQVLKSKLQDYVMLDGKEGQSAPMSLDQLKQQIQDKMRAKRAQQAVAEKEARRAASADETDRLRQALRGGKKQQGSKKKKGGGSVGGSKGFGA